MSLDRARINGTLAAIVELVPSRDWRLVGTAASAVRGIDVPVGDIDILLRLRADVDDWTASIASQPKTETVTAPTWLAEACQYFARIAVDGVSVELSTVEVPVDTDAAECVGDGPWLHFDEIDADGHTVPVVASELRLITEVARGRAQVIRPIIEHLRVVGCDRALVTRGLANAEVPDAIAAQVVAALAD